MEPRSFYQEEEETIDLKQLLIAVMKKWRGLLALMLVVGMLVGVVMQLLPQEETRSKEDTDLIKKFELAAQQRAVYEREREYITNSYLMQVNAESLYIGSVEYYIYDCKDADHVNAGLNAIMKDETLRGQLCAALGISEESELDYFASVQPSKITETTVNGKMQVDICKKLNLIISVMADTEECAEQMLAILKDAVDQQVEQINASSKFTIVQMSESLTYGDSDKIRNAQSDKLSAYNDAYEAYSDLESDFSDEEYALYEEYYINRDPSELPTVLFEINPLKWPVIAGVLAFFMGCAWYACVYLFSGKVKVPDDLQDALGVRTLAFIDEKPTPKNPIDKWINKLELRGYPESVTADYAASILGSEKTIALYSGEDKALGALTEELTAKNGDFACYNLAGKDVATLAAIKDGGRVVFLLRLNGSRMIQLKHELQTLTRMGAKMEGAILVR